MRAYRNRFRIVDVFFLQALGDAVLAPLTNQISHQPGGRVALYARSVGGQLQHHLSGTGVVDEADRLDRELPLFRGERSIEGPRL